MHAFLILSNTNEKVQEKISEICLEHTSTRMDFTIQKIADVRELKDFLKINLPSNTTIVINNFNKATSDAQNALLKEIEEPQKKLDYILTSDSLENILPTIISRCEVIDISNSNTTMSREDSEAIKDFLNSSKGVQLKKISDIKDREKAIEFLTNISKLGHKLLLENKNHVTVLTEAGSTLKALKANGNVQLHLTNFIVNI